MTVRVSSGYGHPDKRQLVIDHFCADIPCLAWDVLAIAEVYLNTLWLTWLKWLRLRLRLSHGLTRMIAWYSRRPPPSSSGIGSGASGVAVGKLKVPASSSCVTGLSASLLSTSNNSG